MLRVFSPYRRERLAKRLATMVVTLSLLCVKVAFSAVFYVDPSASDSNSGTEQQPWRSISKAVAKARGGDTVLLKNGRYGYEGPSSDGTGCLHGCTALAFISSAGSPANWITLKADHPGGAILDCGTRDASHLGCDISIYLNKSAAYWSFQDLVVTGGAFGGITTNDGASHIQILRSTFQNIGNVFTSSPIGITAIGFGQTSTDWWIEGNRIHDIGRTGGLPHLNHDHGIYACGSDARILNNVFYNNTKGWAIQTSHGTRRWLIANNTFAFSGADKSGHIVLWDGESAGSISDIAIRNNIFVGPANSAVVTVLTPLTRSIPGCVIERNITDATSIYDGKRDCDVKDNRLETDPKLMKVSGPPYDFHLRENSPAIGWGRSIREVSRDFEGFQRPVGSASDAGAFQLQTKN